MAKSVSKKPTEYSRASPLHLDNRPDELRFGFEGRQSSVGAGVSVAAHLAMAVIFLLMVRLAPQVLPASLVEELPTMVFLPIPGPGGGGGGGGDPKPEPPRKAEV